MRPLRPARIGKLNRGTKACLAFLLWAAAAIALPAQTFTSLHSFDGTDGQSPVAGLVQGADGNLYGTTTAGGTSSSGTVFKITPGGTLKTIYNFCSQSGCTDGVNPYFGALVLGADGSFYGITGSGGANNNSACNTNASQGCGTVFRITTSGVLTTVYNFCSQSNCTDGNFPDAGLVLGTDGNFYGTTAQGGDTSCNQPGHSGCGTVFRIVPGGTLTTLHSFNGADGVNPGALARGADGNFYGTTVLGGAFAATFCNIGCGTVFSMTPSGTLTTLYNFVFAKRLHGRHQPLFRCTDPRYGWELLRDNILGWH